LLELSTLTLEEREKGGEGGERDRRGLANSISLNSYNCQT
jgi:hypothetical protein